MGDQVVNVIAVSQSELLRVLNEARDEIGDASWLQTLIADALAFKTPMVASSSEACTILRRCSPLKDIEPGAHFEPVKG